MKNKKDLRSKRSPRTSQPKIAIVGAGYWGKNLVRNFHQLGVLKLVCDLDHSILHQVQSDYTGIHTTDNIQSVLNDKNIKGIVISTPAASHYKLAKQALLADKHVFVEKPLSLRYAEGQDLVALANKTKKVLFVGHILHYHPAVIRLKEMIHDGDIGRIQYIYSRRLSLGKIRREENILWSFAPHDISIILCLIGEEPHYIDSVGSNFLHARIADVTMTNLKFPSGIGAHIFVSWLNPFKEQRLVIVGSQGMLVFDDTKPVDEKLVFFPHIIKWQDNIPIPEKAEGIPVSLQRVWKEPLKAECKAFLDSIVTGSKPITSGEEGLRVLRVLEMSQKALQEKENNNLLFSAQTVHTPSSLPGHAPNIPYYTHPTAFIEDGSRIGSGTKIWHFSHILPGTDIGENCNIGQNVVIGPDVKIGKNCKVQNNVSIYKGVTLEDGVFCGPSMVFTNVFNPRAEIRKMDEARPTIVRQGATIGANATIICGNNIGRFAFVGAGAVVTKNVLDHSLVTGNPARTIGWVCSCGERLSDELRCSSCSKKFKMGKDGLQEF